MTTCQPFNSRSQVITASNYNEPLPQLYSLNQNTYINASCNPGFELVGTKYFYCKSDGTWSYGNSPPACLAQVTTTTTEATPDDNTWILIGVVCGVAVIIIAILIIMMVAIWHRDKKRNKREQLMLYNVNRMYPEDNPGYGPSYPYTRDEEGEIYGRPKSPVPPHVPPPPPPPYESHSGDSEERHHYIKNRDRDFDRRRDFDRYRDRSPYYEKKLRSREHLPEGARRSFHDYGDRGSRLSSRMYFPNREYDDTERKSPYYKSRSFDDLSDHGRRAYDSPWVSRRFRHSAYDDMYDHFYDLPRDHRLWRNA